MLINNRSIESDEIQRLLSEGYVALMVVNSLLMGCLQCHPYKFNSNHLCQMPTSGHVFRGFLFNLQIIISNQFNLTNFFFRTLYITCWF